MLSQLILRRDALLHLLQPVSLDLLHNPTRVFGPLPALLPPDLLLQVSLATGDAGPACHLLTANLYLARLADNAAVRTLDPAQKRIRVLQSSRAETADRSSFAERLLGARDEKRARKWSAERHTDAEKPHRPKKKRRRDPNEPPRRRGRPP
ncbi:putative at hook motif protein, partial [Toxoplasma gondii MAS]